MTDLELVKFIRESCKPNDVFRTLDLATWLEMEPHEVLIRLNRVKNKNISGVRVLRAGQFQGNNAWYFREVSDQF